MISALERPGHCRSARGFADGKSVELPSIRCGLRQEPIAESNDLGQG
jgi:hypothetical protein